MNTECKLDSILTHIVGQITILVSFGQVDGICDELKMCSRTHILGFIVFVFLSFPMQESLYSHNSGQDGHLSATPSGVKWSQHNWDLQKYVYILSLWTKGQRYRSEGQLLTWETRVRAVHLLVLQLHPCHREDKCHDIQRPWWCCETENSGNCPPSLLLTMPLWSLLFFVLFYHCGKVFYGRSLSCLTFTANQRLTKAMLRWLFGRVCASISRSLRAGWIPVILHST